MRDCLQWVVVLLCATLVGCATQQAVPNWKNAGAAGSGAESGPGLNAGDRIRITTRASERVDLIFTAYEGEVLVGTPPSGSGLVRIPFDQVASVEREQPADSGATRSGLMAALLIALVFLLAVGLGSLSDPWKPVP